MPATDRLPRHRLPTTDLEVSTFCYGGASWGTRATGEAMDRLIHAFRDAGGNFFDTAHGYSYFFKDGTGASELALADYFRRHGGRDEVIIATKGGLPGAPNYRKVDQYLSPGRIAADIDDSLGRLDCDVIDLYYLHRDDPRLDPGEIIETLNAEVRRGRIRYLGASNWTTARIAAANAHAAAHGLRGFVISQPEWCLAAPNQAIRTHGTHFFDAQDAAWHAQSQIPVAPFTPTAGGYFATGGQGGKEGFDNATSRQRLRRVEQLARELEVTPNQIALAYLLSHPFPVIPILGTIKPEHLADAFGAVAVGLTGEQRGWLEGE